MKSIISEFYEKEEIAEHHENVEKILTKTISVVVANETALMIRAIAKRFGTGMSPICAEILQDAVREMFNSLKAEDRLQLATQVDSQLKTDQADHDLPEFLTVPWVQRAKNLAKDESRGLR